MRRRFWNALYRGRPSWELGSADPELVRQVDERGLRGPGRAIDLGCGTGDNAIALARRGYVVTGIDLAERALSRAREKAAAAGAEIDFRLGDVTTLEAEDGAYDLIVDRGLLMSLAGERARRAYGEAVVRLAAVGGHAYQFQWVLPARPPPLSPAWLATRTRSVVLAPDELERRLGRAFAVEVVRRSVERADDPVIRRMGIRRVAKTSYWLTRRVA
jgi:SAM-dependent methyltransferase